MRQNRKFNKTPEWLYEQYVIKNKSRKEIANQCNLSIGGLKSILIKYNIKKERKNIDVIKIKELLKEGKSVNTISKELQYSVSTIYRVMKKNNLTINYIPDFKQYNDSKDYIICTLYLDGLSSTEIAEKLNMSHRGVLNHLKHCNIFRRSLSEAHFAKNNKEYPTEILDYNIMYDLYINKRLSKKDLGDKFNIDPCVIDSALKKLNIPIRNSSESKIGLMVGNKHPNWQGGITSLHMRLRETFFTQQVPFILKRDNYTCQLCGNKNNLHVHHINSFSSILHSILKENSNLNPIEDVNKLYEIALKDTRFIDKDNLITYCKDCHFYKIHKYKKSKK